MGAAILLQVASLPPSNQLRIAADILDHSAGADQRQVALAIISKARAGVVVMQVTTCSTCTNVVMSTEMATCSGCNVAMCSRCHQTHVCGNAGAEPGGLSRE